MIIYPNAELTGGGLARSRIDDAASYIADPVDVVLAFEEAGAEWAHLVDLDGAREGRPRQHGLLADIALSVSLKLQVAGGFRTRDHFQRMFDAGADRVVIAALAAEAPETACALIDRFGPDHVAIAMDVASASARRPRPDMRPIERLLPNIRHLLLTGPVVPADVADIVAHHPQLDIQVADGLASLAELRAIKEAGAAGAIVGPALWENRVRVEEAIAAGRG